MCSTKIRADLFEDLDNFNLTFEQNEVKEQRSDKQEFCLRMNKAPLSSFNNNIIKCIINECVDQLYILRNINTQDNANFVNRSLEYASITDRYMGRENHCDYRINAAVDNCEKLARDINLVIQVLRECQDELHTSGTFIALKYAVYSLRRMRDEEKDLLREVEENDKYNEDLRRTYEEERLSNIQLMEDTNAEIQKLRFEVEDLLVYTTYELGYYDDWERTRREQNDMTCEKAEQHYQKIIDDTKANITSENRCHHEFENYIDENKNDCLDEIQYWLKHYDEETERRETEMINLKGEMEKLIEDHNALKEKYEAHKQEMEDWLEYKRIKREKEELEALQNWAATKIQAWWRGTMYRKKLGPYRKKKKGKKGKGKDKKGKKAKKK